MNAALGSERDFDGQNLYAEAIPISGGIAWAEASIVVIA